MSRDPNVFSDPTGVLDDYEWPINHFQEEGIDARRNFERTSPTSGIGYIRQQGADSPPTLKYSGTVMTFDQIDMMSKYYGACRDHSIFFQDFQGSEYEVIITIWNPRREWVLDNPRDRAHARNHIWRYDIEMEVLDVRSGEFGNID